MTNFYTRQIFIDINFVYGTTQFIQDSIFNKTINKYDDGVFNLNQSKYSLRNNQYLINAAPGEYESDQSQMLGYQLLYITS